MSIEEKLKALQETFRGQLNERLADISNNWGAFQNTPGFEHLKAVHLHSHKMAGSSATYGYADIAKAAKVLEHYLDPFVYTQQEPIEAVNSAEVEKGIKQIAVEIDKALAD